MHVVQPGSLLETAHNINDAFYARQALSSRVRAEAARFIAARQGLAGSYAGTFLGLGDEPTTIRLFTGERITSASARHLLGQECCRALRLLAVEEFLPAVTRAESGLLEVLGRAATKFTGGNPGLFCCGNCTVGMWRNLLSGGLDRREERLAKGVRALKSTRSDNGKWQRFPFWYTVLALAEIDLPEARAELRRVRAPLERAAKKQAAEGDKTAARRASLAQRSFAAL